MKGKTYIVQRHEEGMRLSAYIKSKISPQFSGKKIQNAIHNGMCRVNGKLERFASYRVCAKDHIQIDRDILSEQTACDPSLQFLYEDEYFLCINKPPRLECTTQSFPGTFLVHRLDKGTSGCLLLAKTKDIQKQLEGLFAERKITKVYIALVYGTLKQTKWTIENTLGPKKEFAGQTIYGSMPHGKHALTHFQCIKQYAEYALIKCVPLTGRTHQIRVHLQETGHPIVGDLLYGANHPIPKGVRRQLLHAYSLHFIHPITQKEHTIIAPLPADFSQYLTSLNKI